MFRRGGGYWTRREGYWHSRYSNCEHTTGNQLHHAGNSLKSKDLRMPESAPTPTGTKADHRLPLRAADVEQFAWSLAGALGADTSGRKAASTAADKWIVPVVRDLQKHKGASLVIAGEQQS